MLTPNLGVGLSSASRKGADGHSPLELKPVSGTQWKPVLALTRLEQGQPALPCEPADAPVLQGQSRSQPGKIAWKSQKLVLPRSHSVVFVFITEEAETKSTFIHLFTPPMPTMAGPSPSWELGTQSRSPRGRNPNEPPPLPPESAFTGSQSPSTPSHMGHRCLNCWAKHLPILFLEYCNHFSLLQCLQAKCGFPWPDSFPRLSPRFIGHMS